MEKANKIGTCNMNPRVWQAIWGCEGKGTFAGWEKPTTLGGSYTAQYACRACRAAHAIADAGFAGRGHLTVPALHGAHEVRQEALRQFQDLAGVSDYRYQGTGRDKGGRPYLLNRRTGQAWTMIPLHLRWTDLRPMGAR